MASSGNPLAKLATAVSDQQVDLQIPIPELVNSP
jgi:hypothetical protein